MDADAVIGGLFGDEGKGLLTDYLATLTDDPVLNIRYSGSANAAHTVVTPNGQRHVFGHFGSGSFAKECHTYLSEYFLVNPPLFHKEHLELREKRIFPNVIINKNSPVVTHLDMMINQIVELFRRKAGVHHGSCGVGVGETMERFENSTYQLTVHDLINLTEQQIFFHLEEIKREYFYPRIQVLLGSKNPNYIESIFKNLLGVSFEDTSNFGLTFSRQAKYMIEDAECVFLNSLEEIENVFPFFKDGTPKIIFEGSQGLLLDPDYGYFPYVTRSSIGLKNIIPLCKQLGVTKLHAIYMTRAYTTRHGAGPLPFEQGMSIFDETNVPNEFQEHLRFAPFNPTLFFDTIDKDYLRFEETEGLEIIREEAITCIDQLSENVPYVDYYDVDADIKYMPKEKFMDTFVYPNFEYISSSPTSENIILNDKLKKS